MKKLFIFIITLTLSMSLISVAQARNTTYYLPIKDAMATKSNTDKLDGTVKFFFANQTPPPVLQTLGTEITNRKTNAFGKLDHVACNWAFLSGLVTLQERAKQLGANAVINIVSYYDKREVTDKSNFECHAGAMVAGVVLKGSFVKIAGQ